MTRAVVAVAVVAVAAGAVAACYFESPEGKPCENSGECDIGRLECVDVDGDGVCLPIVPHDETTCSVDADCAASLFPIEAACEGGLCKCRLTPCAGENIQIVDRVHCTCVDSAGNEGDFCNDDDDCGGDQTLHCEQSKCAKPNHTHDPCNFNVGCADGFQCSCGDFNCATHECLADTDTPCVDDSDCANGSCDTFGDSRCN